MMNAAMRLITRCIEEIRSACLPFSILNVSPNTMLVSGQKAYGLVSYEKLILPVSAARRRKYPVLFISVVCCLFIISVTNAQAIAEKQPVAGQKNAQFSTGGFLKNTNLIFEEHLLPLTHRHQIFRFAQLKSEKTFIK